MRSSARTTSRSSARRARSPRGCALFAGRCTPTWSSPTYGFPTAPGSTWCEQIRERGPRHRHRRADDVRRRRAAVRRPGGRRLGVRRQGRPLGRGGRPPPGTPWCRPRSFAAADLADAMRRRMTPGRPAAHPARVRGARACWPRVSASRRSPGRSSSASPPRRPTSPRSTRSSGLEPRRRDHEGRPFRPARRRPPGLSRHYGSEWSFRVVRVSSDRRLVQTRSPDSPESASCESCRVGSTGGPASRLTLGDHHVRPLNYVRIRLVAKAKTERGASAVEYGLLVALIAIIIIVAVSALGNKPLRHLPARPRPACPPPDPSDLQPPTVVATRRVVATVAALPAARRQVIRPD